MWYTLANNMAFASARYDYAAPARPSVSYSEPCDSPLSQQVLTTATAEERQLMAQLDQEYAELMLERQLLTNQVNTHIGVYRDRKESMRNVINGNDELLRELESTVGSSRMHTFSRLINQVHTTRYDIERNMSEIDALMQVISAVTEDRGQTGMEEELCPQRASFTAESRVRSAPGLDRQELRPLNHGSVHESGSVVPMHHFLLAQFAESAASYFPVREEAFAQVLQSPERDILEDQISEVLAHHGMSDDQNLEISEGFAQHEEVSELYQDYVQRMGESATIRHAVRAQLGELFNLHGSIQGLMSENNEIMREISETVGPSRSHAFSAVMENHRITQRNVERDTRLVANVGLLLDTTVQQPGFNREVFNQREAAAAVQAAFLTEGSSHPHGRRNVNRQRVARPRATRQQRVGVTRPPPGLPPPTWQTLEQPRVDEALLSSVPMPLAVATTNSVQASGHNHSEQTVLSAASLPKAAPRAPHLRPVQKLFQAAAAA